MGLSPFTCCSCLRQCNAGVAVQLEETILTLQSKITIAIFLNWLTLLFIPSSAFCSNSQSVVTVIALFLQEADFTRLQLLHLSYLCINIIFFFFKKLSFHGKQPKGAASPWCRSRGARTITAGRWGVSHAMSLRFREGRTVRNVMISGWTWTCDPWTQPFLIFFFCGPTGWTAGGGEGQGSLLFICVLICRLVEISSCEPKSKLGKKYSLIVLIWKMLLKVSKILP